MPADSKLFKEDDVSLNYGSASLKGKMLEDKVCLDPVGLRCASKVSFLALYDAQGLGAFDGILGLSNHHSESKKGMNFVQQLKESGVIKNALVSFDVNQNQSIALFGQFNASLVWGGSKGLVSLPTYGYLPEFVGAQKNWALEA